VFATWSWPAPMPIKRCKSPVQAIRVKASERAGYRAARSGNVGPPASTLAGREGAPGARATRRLLAISEALRVDRRGPGDEARGAVWSGPLPGPD
jgi:hypothetical protein